MKMNGGSEFTGYRERAAMWKGREGAGGVALVGPGARRAARRCPHGAPQANGRAQKRDVAAEVGEQALTRRASGPGKEPLTEHPRQ